MLIPRATSILLLAVQAYASSAVSDPHSEQRSSYLAVFTGLLTSFSSDWPRALGALGTKCNASRLCRSGYCDRICKKPVAAGEKCAKDVGCAEHADGAVCLTKAASFTVYSKSGTKLTKDVKAGRCSYIHSLGKGMKCESNDNCYADKFVCSKQKCVDKPKKDLPFQHECTSDAFCASGRCNKGKCACKLAINEADNDCGSKKTCDAKSRACIPRTGYCNIDDPGTCFSYHCVSACAGASTCPSSCSCEKDSDCGIQDQWACEEDSKVCKAKPGSLLFKQTCYDDFSCESGRCLANRCGCKMASKDCPAGQTCDANTRTCIARSGFCQLENPGTCATYHCVSGCSEPPCQASCACTSNDDCGTDSTCQQTSNGQVCDIPPLR